ncbi:MAG: hypothetical protein V2A73_02990 [Pseudomonadota bacterium]
MPELFQNQRSSVQIEREIAATRNDLLDAVHDLEQSMRRRLDWRSSVRRRPLLFVGGAFFLGLLLSVRLGQH